MELATRSAADRRSRLICGLQPTLTIIEAIFHLLRAGCSWRLLPDSFLPLADGLPLVLRSA